MNQKPVSAYEKAGGMAYFPRMLCKIRLHAAGELHPDFHSNLGKGADGRCLSFSPHQPEYFHEDVPILTPWAASWASCMRY